MPGAVMSLHRLMPFRGYEVIAALVRPFFATRDFSTVGVATLAWALRALAGSVMFPVAVGDLVNSLSGNVRSIPVTTWTLLVASLCINVATEWAFLPYWKLFTRKISDIRRALAVSVSEVGTEDQGDLVGKVASDVDFVMWNTAGAIATILPNFFNAALGIVTIANSSLLMAGVAALLVPPYFVIVQNYSKKCC